MNSTPAPLPTMHDAPSAEGLNGLCIGVTRPRHQAEALITALGSQGATVLACPLMTVQPVTHPQPVVETLHQLDQFDWVVWTSANGVAETMRLAEQAGLSPAIFQPLQRGVVGEQTATALSAYGLQPTLMPDRYDAMGLFDALDAAVPKLAGLRVLLLRADIAPNDLPHRLREAQVQVTDLPVYRTLPAPAGPEWEAFEAALTQGSLDALTFASGSAVREFARRMAPLLAEAPDRLDRIVLAAIGPATAQTLIEQLGRVEVCAEPHTTAGLVQALITHYQLSETQKARS